MQLADLTLCLGEELDPVELHLLEERGHRLLVARQPVEPLGDDNVKLAPARVGQQGLVPRADGRGAGDGVIRITANEMPTLILNQTLCVSHLILD